MSAGSAMEVGEDLKCIVVDAEFSFPKNDGNKKQILDLLLKVEDVVKNATGVYSDNWQDVNDERKVEINLELPDRAHVDEIYGYFDDIQALLPEISGSEKGEGNDSRLGPEMVKVIEERESMAEPSTSSKIHEEQVSESTKNLGKNKPKGRSKHKCPFPHCQSSVIHLPRHMRVCHKWSPRKSRSVLNSFNLRREKSKDIRKTKRSYNSIICPVRHCNSVVKRIHNHLTSVHKLKTNSIKYKTYLDIAVPHNVDPVTSSELLESQLSDSSVSSSELYKPAQKKIKKETHVKRLSNFYETVYSNSEKGDQDSEEESPVESISEDSNDSEFLPADECLNLNDEQCSDISEDEEEVNASSDPVFAPELRKIFDMFETWLRGADGGRKGDRSATQCRRQIELVVSYIDSSSPSLTGILKKKLLRDEWLSKFEKEKRPGTIKSYLGSLNQFYAFLRCENVDVGVSSEILESLSQQVKLWTSSFRKKSLDRFWEKRMDDMSSMRTPQQVSAFDTSEVARDAVRLLGEYQDKRDQEKPTQPEYTTVRDYLLTVLCINNGSRSGTLANMTLREFEQASKDDDCFIIRVRDHKTFTTHGPVNVVFNASLYQYTKIFIEKFRNELDGVNTDGDSAVFLSVNQKKLTSSQVGSQIGSCWGKVFGRETSLGGATAFRKAAVSAVHECREDMRGDLANLMVHKQSTADRYYLLQNKGKSAVRTSKELTRIMRHGADNKSTNNATEDDESAVSETSEKQGSSGRHKWTSTQVSELKCAFSPHIVRQLITMEDVRKTVSEAPALKGIPLKKILDKIRSYFGNNAEESIETPSLPTEQESSVDRLKRAGLHKPRTNKDLACCDISSQDELIGDNGDLASCDSPSQDEVIGENRGDLDRARELHHRALAIREQLHGNDHIATATSLNNIGGVYHERGDLAKAKNYYWQALEIKGRNYGWDFPHMANSFNNIAEISHEQGDLCGAISIHKRALKIRQRLYGDDHPDVADSLNNIGVICHKREELSAARKYHAKALGIRKKVYGEDHLEVACSLNSLGEVCYDEGDLAASEENHIQALRIRQRYSVTSWHPEVITSLHNLMMVYIADQKISIATDYAYEVFKVCQKIHGMRDARTVKAFRKLTELSKRASQGRGFDFYLAAHEYVERLSCL